MNKAQSKYYNTACLMDEALLALLEKKDYEYITVKELCEKAGVNRSTFYLHYESMDDLLTESLSYIYSRFNDSFAGVSFTPARISAYDLDALYLITPEYVVPYLEFIAKNRRLFTAALARPNTFRVKQRFDSINAGVFEPILSRFSVEPDDRKYVLAFHISGMHSLIAEWVRGGCRESTQKIAALIIECTKPYGENRAK